MFSYKLPKKLQKEIGQKEMREKNLRRKEMVRSQKIDDQKKNDLLIKHSLYMVAQLLEIESFLGLSPCDHKCCQAEYPADCRCACCYGECSAYPRQELLTQDKLDPVLRFNVESVFKPFRNFLECEKPGC